MTFETCLAQAKNCRSHGDEEGALMYEVRAERKKNYTRFFYEEQAKACEANGNAESAAKFRAIAAKKLKEETKEKPKETKADGKNSIVKAA